MRFSKRKSGVHKKASDLVTLTGCQIAVLIYSPAGKPYSFGNPSVDEVATRYLNESPIIHDHNSFFQAKFAELNQTLNESLKAIEEIKGKQKALKPKLEGIPMNKLCDVEHASKEELRKMESDCMELLAKLEIRKKDIMD
ncbi:unnamed protein product [Linum tenue]|uniref:MADS-box domain-containing protein n=1 Tax=Linum tenue TaxID=586396 RepID=A0AAV0RQK1_9ROSI|nr:unnamed protein product [Linum tenue]